MGEKSGGLAVGLRCVYRWLRLSLQMMRFHTGNRTPYRYQTFLLLYLFLSILSTSITAFNSTALLLPLLVVILDILHRLVVILIFFFICCVFFVACVGLPVERVGGLVSDWLLGADCQLFVVIVEVMGWIFLMVLWVIMKLLLLMRLVLLWVPLVIALLRAGDVSRQTVQR